MRREKGNTVSRLRIPLLAAAAAVAVVLSGCSGPSEEAPSDGDAPIEVSIGVLARDEPDMNQVSQHLAGEGVNLEVRVFDDNIAMNRATEDGSLDANYFQSASYLDSYNESNGGHLERYGPWLHTHAVQFVSEKYDSVDDFPDGAMIGIANDSFNRSRELRLIETTGLITLREGVDLLTTLDVVENPKNVQFLEIDPRSRVGAFPDLDAMTAPGMTVYQMNNPNVNLLAEESVEVYTEFGGVYLVTADVEANKVWMDKIIEYMLSDEYRAWLAEEYRGIKKSPEKE